MSLSDSMRRLHAQEDEGASGTVKDYSTDCTLSRNSEGNVVLTMEANGRSVNRTLEDLISGPCRGMRGRMLEEAIKETMKVYLKG